jgi:adenylate cyclase class 2
MADNNQEREVKFFLKDLGRYEAKIVELGGELTKPRVHEVNLRFDTPERALSSSAQVLRLRKDTRNRVTYKGPGSLEGGVRSRREIEFSVDDFDKGRLFFESLGYEVMMTYEKYRTTYTIGEAEIVLDEMPYGKFIEIEASDPKTIHSMADQLALDWEARIFESYTVLFEIVKMTHSLEFTDLTFENFANIEVSAEDLGIKLAG